MQTNINHTAPNCDDARETQLLTVATARRRILSIAKFQLALERETVALRDGLSRILAVDIISPVNVPGHTNSAMDGYALSGNDLPTDEIREYRVIGTAYAGSPFPSYCHTGECVRIMTGAPMPPGTDTVIMQEHAAPASEQRVGIGSGHRPGQNVRQAGEDIAQGDPVLKAGRQLTPADLGVIASTGFGEISVRRRLRVAFFSTGDELRSIGEPLNKGDVFDSNRYSLYGMLKKMGVEILDLGVVPDDPERLREAFDSAAKMADFVISSGGVSVGVTDYTKAILEELGKMNFWKIAMKPGRPLTFGQLGNALFFGLPGNPVAVMVTFYQFVMPALHYLSTGEPYIPFILQVINGSRIRKRPGRYEFLRGILRSESNGILSVSNLGQQGSGILTSMSCGNCFIHLPEDCAGVDEGETVSVQPFNSFM